MLTKMQSGEDFAIQTKGGGKIVVPNVIAEPQFNPTLAYATGKKTWYGSVQYACISATAEPAEGQSNPTPEEDTAHWTEISVEELAKKSETVTNMRTVNGKALDKDVTLTGADISVSGTAATRLDAALAGKASKADATLTERGFSEWSFAHTPLSAEAKRMFYDESAAAAVNDYAVTLRDNSLFVGDYNAAALSLSSDGLSYVFLNGSPTASTVWGPYGTTVATRERLPGYRLGPDSASNPNRDELLASEAEAEALRDGVAEANAQTEVTESKPNNPHLLADAFPITFTLHDTDYRVSDGDSRLSFEGSSAFTMMVGGYGICDFKSDNTFDNAWLQAENLKFNGRDPVEGVWPVLHFAVSDVKVRDVSVLMKSAVVAPSTSATTGQAADAKATGDALAERPTKSALDEGWWSEWGYSDIQGDITIDGELHVICGPFLDGGGNEWAMMIATASESGVTGYAGDYNESDDELHFSFDEFGVIGSLTAKRHRVAAPVPTKPEDIGAAKRASNPTAGNLAALDANGNPTDSGVAKSDVENLFFAQYYPDGSVQSTAEFTQGLKYDNPDEENRTIMVRPFCEMADDLNNDNSDLSGRVVIPPFIDSDGNGYITDDGTRYKVVGVDYKPIPPTPPPPPAPGFHGGILTAIVAPNTVTYVGDGAFYACSLLASISIPAAETVELAFNRCSSLTTVSLPEATYIGQTFLSCSSLTTVSLPKVTYVGYNAFYACSSLTSIDFGDITRADVPTLSNKRAFFGVPETCRIIVPDAQYDAWVAADGWRDLVADGYRFLKHSEWEYARKYEVPKLSVDNTPADVNIVHISQDDYEQLVIDGNALSSTLYVVSGDCINAYGQQIKNIAPGNKLSDAVNLEQLNAIDSKAQRLNAISSNNALSNFYSTVMQSGVNAMTIESMCSALFELVKTLGY